MTSSSPPTGDVTFKLPVEKVAALTSIRWLFDASLIRTSAWLDGVLGTFQAYCPAEAGVLFTIVLQLLPLFIEYSILTLVTPTYVQAIVCVVPVGHSSP